MTYRTSSSNLLKALEFYNQHLIEQGDLKTFALLQSSILRFTVPGWGGPAPKGKRSSTEEVKAGLDFLAQLPLEKLNTAIETQNKVFDDLNMDKKARRQPRHYLLSFVTWVKNSGLLIQEKLVEPPKEVEVIKEYGLKHKRKPRVHAKTTKRVGHYKKFSLGSVEGDFINKPLEMEFKELKKFQSTVLERASLCTIEKLEKDILRLLGWFYRYQSNNLNLEDLTFSSFMPVTELYPKISNYKEIQEYWIAQAKAKSKAEEIATTFLSTLENFFEWRKEILGEDLAIRTKLGTFDTVLVLAKFLYHEQSNRSEYNNYEDIPLVKYLQRARTKMHKKYKQFGPKISRRDYMIPWSKVLEIREILRKEAETKDVKFFDMDALKYRYLPRPNSAIAKDMQLFLLLAFFTIIPPDRQRTFRELQIGKTLKQGIFVGERFIPKEKMDDPNTACWYIHLGMNDYKTSKTYGEWIGELPNESFGDKTFYNYLDEWLYHGYQDVSGCWHGWRDSLKPHNREYFFVATNGKTFTDRSITQRIRGVFMRLAEVPVNPHLLRAIFRTHLKNSGASLAELESSAYWMKHDMKTADDNYTFQDREAKLRPATLMMERLNKPSS